MPAQRKRQEARARIKEMMESALDRVMPADGSEPLHGSRFIDFEDQVAEVGLPVMAAMIEERAALDAAAWVERPGWCPHCGSERVYLDKEPTQEEMRSPFGPLTVRLQQCRCRGCGGSFSPSATRLGFAAGCAVDA